MLTFDYHAKVFWPLLRHQTSNAWELVLTHKYLGLTFQVKAHSCSVDNKGRKNEGINGVESLAWGKFVKRVRLIFTFFSGLFNLLTILSFLSTLSAETFLPAPYSHATLVIRAHHSCACYSSFLQKVKAAGSSAGQMEGCPSMLGSPSLFRQGIDCNNFPSAYMLLLLLSSPKQSRGINSSKHFWLFTPQN